MCIASWKKKKVMCKSGSGAWRARDMVLGVAPPRAVGKGRAKDVVVPFRC